jgi:hypothetical protein
MRARTIRRAAERAASKLASTASIPVQPEIPEVVAPSSSPARIAANQANAKLSTGPSPAGIAASCQNHTIHGLARHSNGTFKLLTSEDPIGFEAFKQSLLNEHVPTSPTEVILVTAMVESSWLAQRAQRLHDVCINPDTGEITDTAKASLYMRYFTTHTRAFHKSLSDLLKLRSEKRKATIGFEAQKHQTERHEMAKITHQIELFAKDMKAQRDLTDLVIATTQATRDIPGFEAKYMAELEKRGLDKEWWQPQTTTQAA